MTKTVISQKNPAATESSVPPVHSNNKRKVVYAGLALTVLLIVVVAYFYLARTIGSSIGISIASTIATRTSQINWNTLGGHINPYNPALQQWLQNKGLDMSDPLAAQLLGQELARQSSMLGFVDAFHFIAWSFVVLAPLLFLLRGGRNSAGKSLH